MSTRFSSTGADDFLALIIRFGYIKESFPTLDYKACREKLTEVSERTGGRKGGLQFPSDENPDVTDGTAVYLFLIETLASLCDSNRKFAETLFDSRYCKLSPEEFYETGYSMYFLHLLQVLFNPFWEIHKRILRGTSNKMLMSADWKETEYEDVSISEWQITDMLFSQNAREACEIISQLNADKSQIAELKKRIIRKDKDGFIEYAIENGIDFSNCKFVYSKIELYDTSDSASDGEGTFRNLIRKNLLDNEVVKQLMPKWEYQCLYNEAYHNETLTIRHYLGVLYTALLGDLSLLLSHINECCIDSEAVADLDEFIKSHKLELPLSQYRNRESDDAIHLNIPALEDFKSRFLTGNQLPPSVGKAKSKDVCYDWEGHEACAWKEKNMFYLYNLLVENGFMAWSSDSAFAFVYRMAPNYQPERSDVEKIVWLGDTSSLWTMINYFHGNTYKVDKLTSEFFIKADGSPFKGGKHFTNSKDPKINAILKDPLFEKK